MPRYVALLQPFEASRSPEAARNDLIMSKLDGFELQTITLCYNEVMGTLRSVRRARSQNPILILPERPTLRRCVLTAVRNGHRPSPLS